MVFLDLQRLTVTPCKEPHVTRGSIRKWMSQRLHLAFNRQQPLYLLQQASLKGKEPHGQVMEQDGQTATGRPGRKETRSSQHICLHLCLREEKLKYLLLENKGEKEPVNISQLKQEPKRHRGSFCPQLMKETCRDLWHISCITAIPNVSTVKGVTIAEKLPLLEPQCNTTRALFKEGGINVRTWTVNAELLVC